MIPPSLQQSGLQTKSISPPLLRRRAKRLLSKFTLGKQIFSSNKVGEKKKTQTIPHHAFVSSKFQNHYAALHNCSCHVHRWRVSAHSHTGMNTILIKSRPFPAWCANDLLQPVCKVAKHPVFVKSHSSTTVLSPKYLVECKLGRKYLHLSKKRR